MSGPPAQLGEPSETTVEPPVGSVTTRVWTAPSNASANSNSKETRISNVFGNNKKNKSRAVAYARVSSKRQAEEGVSLDAQVERLIAYAEFRGLYLDPEDIYIDDGISAAIHLWSKQHIQLYLQLFFVRGSAPTPLTPNTPVINRGNKSSRKADNLLIVEMLWSHN